MKAAYSPRSSRRRRRRCPRQPDAFSPGRTRTRAVPMGPPFFRWDVRKRPKPADPPRHGEGDHRRWWRGTDGVARRRLGRNHLACPSTMLRMEIGIATCRERECQYVYISVVAGSLNKKKKIQYSLAVK